MNRDDGQNQGAGAAGEATTPDDGLRSLSVVVPVYHEEENVVPLVEGIVRHCRPLGLPFEVVIVDDGSQDATVQRLVDLAPRVPELVVVRLRRNFGQTPALQAGFDRARGDVIVTMDGDLQNDPRDIPRLLERLREGADVVSGWRANRQDTLVLRKIPSWVANRLIRQVTKVPIHDQGCSLKAYRRKVVEALDLYSDMHRFITIMAMPSGAVIDEIEVEHHARVAGESKYGLSRVFKVMADLLTIQMVTRFRANPVRWFALIGLPFLVASMGVGVVSIFQWNELVVLPTVSVLFGMTFVFCLLAGVLGEAIIDLSGQPRRRSVMVREWRSRA